jgi:hypothetical protein
MRGKQTEETQMKRQSKLMTAMATTLVVGMTAVPPATAHGGGQGYGHGQSRYGPCASQQGMMGPGAAQQSMMGGGHGQGSGMMGPGMGMMGQGMGMMSPGMGMMGPGAGQPGKMGPRSGMMTPGRGGPGVLDRDLSVDDVKAILEHRLSHQGNARLRVGTVEAKSDDSVVAEIETVDGSLVDRFEVDVHTGRMQRIQ